jgi:hypothetical protein
MPAKPENIVLADILADVRSLTRRNLKRLSAVDPYKLYEAYRAPLHSINWIAAHLTWAENGLLLKGVCDQPLNLPWTSRFTFGGDFDPQGDLPKYEEILTAMEQVHEQSQKLLREIPLESLDEPNNLGFSFGGDSSKRKIIYHAIRHEPMHNGQLSWICKMNGIGTE